MASTSGSERVDNRPLRVLLLIDSLGLGGAERLLVGFAAGAGAAGLEVRVASLSGRGDHRDEMVPALRALGVEPEFLGIRRLRSPGAVPAVAAAIRRSGCDVVHAHLEYAATLGTLAGALARRPVLCSFHHVPSDDADRRTAVREWLAVATASRSAGTIFVSEASRREFARRYRRWQRGWVVVRNGIDVPPLPPGVGLFPGDLQLDAGTPAVLLPAALRGRKGHDTALRAWPAVAAAVPGARLVLAGSGVEEPMLRAMAASLGVTEQVVFAGFRTDVADLMRASTLVVLPSETEALPTVLMEAAAAGRAVVATDVGGVPEVVEDGVTGLLVPPGDPDRFAAAVIELLTDGGRRAAMEREARARAEGEFSFERWSSDLRALYRRAVSAR